MHPHDFLERVWPSNGFYALALPFKLQDTGRQVYQHKTFESIEAAAAHAASVAGTQDVFFCVHSLKERQVWNPKKLNYRTGEPGAYEVRVQTNMQESRTFFFDLDVGPDDEKKYANQREALAGLIDFCKATGLPKPLVTSSGGGLHVYWTLDRSLPSGDWLTEATKLRRIAEHHKLRVDPARTTDTASVLRVAGTFNRKNPDAPRPVRVLVDGGETSMNAFTDKLDELVEQHDLTLDLPRPQNAPVAGLGVSSNLKLEHDTPPVRMAALVAACNQVARLARLKGAVSEPEWYHSLNLVRFTKNGRKFAHRISEQHPEYDYGETETKLYQLEAKDVGPTTCQKLAEVCGSEHCEGCPFLGKYKSPLVAARYRDEAPAPQTPAVQAAAAAAPSTRNIPDAPYPYKRLRDKGVVKVDIDEEGIEHHAQLYENDLYPISRMIDVNEGKEVQRWCAHLPRSGVKEFTLEVSDLYDLRHLAVALAKNGVYTDSHTIKGVKDYMIAYIKELQKVADADTQFNHLGWDHAVQKFAMPEGIFMPDGSTLPVTYSTKAMSAVEHVTKKGTLEDQIEHLKFYARDGYIIHQFYLAAALAAPIFYATNQHGAVINASGESGAYKSTTLYAASSLWGDPKMYAINGTNKGATELGRQQRMDTLANLPLCVDEITYMTVGDAANTVMGVTQPGHRIRLLKNGAENKTITDSYKATLMLSTANSSLHNILSSNNTAGTAGSMRVIEIEFQPTTVHTKEQADQFIWGLRENHGHIGPAFMRYVVQNRAAVEKRVQNKVAEIDRQATIQGAERFWSAVIGATLVAAEIAKELGLLDFNTEKMLLWSVNRQIPAMRGVVHDEYAHPLAILTDFIDQNSSRIIVTDNMQGAGGNVTYITREPRGDIIGHYHKPSGYLNINRGAFKDYCARFGSNSSHIIRDLHKPTLTATGRELRVVANQNAKKVLGAGTELAKVQSWCFVINMLHPEIAETVNFEVVGGDTPAPKTASTEGRS